MTNPYTKANIEEIINNIRSKEVDLQYAKSSGPGGQNVNKRETKAQGSRDVSRSNIFPEIYKSRCMKLYKNIINEEGILKISSQIYRTQEANKDVVYNKLSEIIIACFKEHKVRKATKIPKKAIEQRLADKKVRSHIRATRSKPKFTDE